VIPKSYSLLPHDDKELQSVEIDGSARKRGVFLDMGANVGLVLISINSENPYNIIIISFAA
jgi:Zn-finger nucleic acid-binding protein